jgi:Protein of unknown function (DUF2790)
MNIYATTLAAVLALFSTQSHAISRAEIAYVIRIDVDPQACGITDAVMVYKTPSGETKELQYQVLGDGCRGG